MNFRYRLLTTLPRTNSTVRTPTSCTPISNSPTSPIYKAQELPVTSGRYHKHSHAG
ncbi:hypothetical protein BDV28DRAFT_142295 [Aspergillus coremiiformis]|uniref:Uncharacterized protein n=1 Tax=Aspergillus coremiiformis TaxID=138285 RepID=A0A5N6YZ28_9EURO|nr:hypothetical protein BDV28DRAFT_142295 [Aspergillus coremiiformis]